MPHFSDCCEIDEYICQRCGVVHCGNCEPSSWLPNITQNKRAGNICPSCLEKHTDWKIIAKPKREKVAFGTFTGIMYEISVDNMNKLEIRNVCPQCGGQYNMENKIAESNGKWLFKCPRCSANIQIVR